LAPRGVELQILEHDVVIESVVLAPGQALALGERLVAAVLELAAAEEMEL
jgi:hypothetical protein